MLRWPRPSVQDHWTLKLIRGAVAYCPGDKRDLERGRLSTSWLPRWKINTGLCGGTSHLNMNQRYWVLHVCPRECTWVKKRQREIPFFNRKSLATRQRLKILYSQTPSLFVTITATEIFDLNFRHSRSGNLSGAHGKKRNRLLHPNQLQQCNVWTAKLLESPI